MSRKQLRSPRTGRSVLVVDDDVEYLASAEVFLSREGHTVIPMSSPVEALELLRTRDVDLVLLDFFMPEMTGEEFLRELRTWNPNVHVILQTGYASEQPPRELVKRLDIQGYYDKGEGPQKLLLWTDLGLKAATAMKAQERSLRGLEEVLARAPLLFQPQSLDDLLGRVAKEMASLIPDVEATLGVTRESPLPSPSALVLLAANGDLSARAASGRFTTSAPLSESLSDDEIAAVRRAVERGAPVLSEGGTAVPLGEGERIVGAVHLDRAFDARDCATLTALGRQAGTAARIILTAFKSGAGGAA